MSMRIEYVCPVLPAVIVQLMASPSWQHLQQEAAVMGAECWRRKKEVRSSVSMHLIAGGLNVSEELLHSEQQVTGKLHCAAGDGARADNTAARG